ncbi:phosphoribosyltransferase [Candidatus Peregrinibacteria bacterium]|nr:phosphoribosyltransferase [Candidatus Peregrinibacteria bacterium]
MIFHDRKEAGKKLAEKLSGYKDKKDVILLGLPRGGVVTAHEIAKQLNLPLDIVVPRKIGAPGNPELAIGAITETGEGIFDENLVKMTNASKDYIDKIVEEEKKEAVRRLKVYRGKKEPKKIKDNTVILIDDGIATGSTMRAAIKSVKKKGAKKIVVAVPVLPRDAVKKFKEEADELVYIDAPYFFGAVGAFYEVFEQTTDKEVVEIMKKV